MAKRKRHNERTKREKKRFQKTMARKQTLKSPEASEGRPASDSDIARRSSNSAAQAKKRSLESPEEYEVRRASNSAAQAKKRASETLEESEARRSSNAAVLSTSRARPWASKENAAFSYNPQINYKDDRLVQIGSMAMQCPHCKAVKFRGETPGMCCSNGKIRLPVMVDPPELLYSLITGEGEDSKDFQRNIRRYNSCFQMTSFGAKIIREANYMPTFKVNGQVYHRIGTLKEAEGEDPKFLQIYFMDDQNKQAELRTRNVKQTKTETVLKLQDMLHRENVYVRDFKYNLEKMTPEQSLIIRADRTPAGEHERRYNAPTTSEVAVVVTREASNAYRDILLELRNDEPLKRIADTHRSYDALQYPLIFWKGDDGYHFELYQIDPKTGLPNKKKISAMDFYAYRLMQRPGEFNILLRCKDLLSQFAVDMFVKVESERLRYYRLNQKDMRVEDYTQLHDAIAKDGNANNVGQLVVLPASFTGGPRYMHQRTQDAMAYVRSYGRPDLFVTFTCNSKWKEITEELMDGQKPQDRHDLIARVFRQKLKALMDVFTKGKVFGPVKCFMYTVEWQKRGLPHAHILLWMQNIIRPDQVDEIISAEIPNKEVDPELFDIITSQMVHGPCGKINTKCPCMQKDKCTKKFPKEFLRETHTGKDGYPQYRRRRPEDGGLTAMVKVHGADFEIDNRWIVPYSPLLSKLFSAHLNIEYCSSIKSIKYVCKYINKGSDMAQIELKNPNDEVERYEIGRYVSSNEAFWRLFGFPIHERHPTVTHLSVHLENGQRVYFTSENAQQRMETSRETTLTSFFKLCKDDDFATTLFYFEVPKFYTWNASSKKWTRRKQGEAVEGFPGIKASDALGRVFTVHPKNDECFFLRILLHDVKGPTSFQDLRTVDGTICGTYREACLKRGLLEGDEHWDKTLEEAGVTDSPRMLRNLFAVMLQTCGIGNCLQLWETHKENLSEDILHEARLQNPHLEIDFNDSIFNRALIMIEDKVRDLGGSSLKNFLLPTPHRDSDSLTNTEILRETSYNRDELAVFVEDNERKMVNDQKEAFETIVQAVSDGMGGIFFVDAPGGTGKTFLINLLLAKIRQRNWIALAVASSGIAATLLDGGRTAHSAFKLPLNLATADYPTCSIKKGTDKAKLLQSCKMVVWDECTMSHKAAFEALDRTLQDLKGNKDKMGGITLVLAGDFRQTLPVVPRGTRADQVDACLKTSYLWKDVKRLRLSTNMRVRFSGGASSSDEFAARLLQLGNGTIQPDEQSGLIRMSDFGTIMKSLHELKESVFPNIGQHFKDRQWLCQRAILAPRNDVVRRINKEILLQLPGTTMIYKSINTVSDNDEAVNFPTEFLNSVELPGLPQHLLELKEGAPIVLMRNLDPPTLCNGTRLTVKRMMPHVIEATIITGRAAGQDVFIPRIPVIPTDSPIQLKRLQFPVGLSFAMTVNKAQGQSLKVVGLDLQEPCFSHGQLYVGCSRVGEMKNLFILCPDGKTSNVVFPEALQG